MLQLMLVVTNKHSKCLTVSPVESACQNRRNAALSLGNVRNPRYTGYAIPMFGCKESKQTIDLWTHFIIRKKGSHSSL